MIPACIRFQLLLAACVRFSCCSRLRPFQLLPDCVRFGCCSPTASASTLLPDGVRFVCCSPIAFASTAAPRLRSLRLLLPASCSGRFRSSHVHYSRIFIVEFEVQVATKVARHNLNILIHMAWKHCGCPWLNACVLLHIDRALFFVRFSSIIWPEIEAMQTGSYVNVIL